MSAGNASLSGSATKQEHYHAFLSHNRADKFLVEILAAELEKHGIRCWLDKWNLIPGDPWPLAIEEALSCCDTCVVFFGPHGLGPWHNEEMWLALQHRVNSRERKLRVLPVILPGGQRAKESDLPGFLQGTTWVEFRQSIDEEDALHRLACGIKRIQPGRGPGATIAVGECPYLGLKTFQPDDAPLFFGRAAKVQELVDRLRNNFGTSKEERFLALIGASGSGKSSLALAGLIPAIQRGDLPESARWPLVRCRPGGRPWENLQIALANNQQIASHIAALPALITRPEDEQRRLHLTAQLALHDQLENHRLFILIDQFEEIFTLCDDEMERGQLIDNLLYASNMTEGRAIVVLTMRADFYGQCATYPGLRAAIADHQSLIGPLSEEELRDAIESPAQLVGGELEPGLMELLLADMKGQAGALPFLEHALFKLWEMRNGRRLTAKAYTDMGRLGGALDAHAEEFFTKILSVEEQSLCRLLLVDLVHPGEGAADTKKRVLLDDVAPTDAARAVLKKLADARLVTTGRDDRPEAAQAELAHEALITGWRRLGDWVNENREQSRLKERLLDSAREWQRNSKKEDFLYRGAQLATAEESFGSSGESLPKLGKDFLEASIAQRQRERAEQQRQLRKRQRLLAAALAVFAVLAVGASAAAVFGFWQKSEAEKHARLAIDAERSANEQAELASIAKERTSEVASEANVSLARYSQEAGNNAQSLAYLTQALRLDQRNYGAVALIGTILTQTGWPLLVALPMQHDSSIGSAQFSPDGLRLVTASDDKTARLWDAATGEQIGGPMKHEGAVNSAQFSPDGQRVVTSSQDGTARVWDAATGEQIGGPMKHEGAVNSAQFSPDGRRVVSASADGTARVWDGATGKAIGVPMKHGALVYDLKEPPSKIKHADVYSAEFIPDGMTRKAIAVPMKHEGAVYDVKQVKMDAPVLSAQFSPDGRRVVTSSEDKTARLWDAATGRQIGEPMKHEGVVYSAQFSPDGQRVVTSSEDKTARLWDAATGKPIGEPMKHEAAVKSAHFSPDGQRVVTASGDKTARLWDGANGKAIGEPMKHEGGVTSAHFSPDGQRVATASDDKTARLWDAATGKPIGEPMKHEAAVNSAQFSPDGRRVVSASDDKTARLWDAATGKPIGEPMKHDDWVTSAQFSPDGQRVLTASGDNTARLWDAATGKPIGVPMKHEGAVKSAHFSPDGQRVVTASEDKTARLWDAATGKALSEPMKHDGEVWSARFSPDGQRVLTASADGTTRLWATARLWDAATGKQIGVPMKHERGIDSVHEVYSVTGGRDQKESPVLSAQFSPDGQRVMTASQDGTARVWDAATGKPIGVPMKHEDEVYTVTGGRDWKARVLSAQFSPDGQRVVTSSQDGTARVWDAATGNPIGEPMKHGDWVTSAQFSPDGQRVLTASGDNTARLWDVPTTSGKDTTDDLLLLADLAEATGGVALRTSWQAQIRNSLTPGQVRATCEKIAARFAGAFSKLTPLQRFLKWSVSEPTSRTISPFSELTVAEWVENRITDGTFDGLRAAIQVEPANARLAAHFGRALADHAMEKKTDPDETRRALGEADFQTRRALRLAPANEDIKKLRAEVVKLLKLPE